MVKNGVVHLMWAAMKNPSPAQAASLVKNGARVDDSDAGGRTALMWAAVSGRNPWVIVALLKAGATPGLKSHEGRTAVDYARANERLKGTAALAALESATGRNSP